MKKNEQHKSSHSLDVRVKRPRGIKRFITFSTSSQVQVEKKKGCQEQKCGTIFFLSLEEKKQEKRTPDPIYATHFW